MQKKIGVGWWDSDHLGRLIQADEQKGLQDECVWTEMGTSCWEPETKPQSRAARSSVLSDSCGSGSLTSFRKWFFFQWGSERIVNSVKKVVKHRVKRNSGASFKEVSSELNMNCRLNGRQALEGRMPTVQAESHCHRGPIYSRMVFAGSGQRALGAKVEV